MAAAVCTLHDEEAASAVDRTSTVMENERAAADQLRAKSATQSSKYSTRAAVGIQLQAWLFLGSYDGALANTTFVSLVVSCRLPNTSSPSVTSATSSACSPAGPNTACTLSPPRSDTRLASRSSLSTSWTPTSSVASRSACRRLTDCRRPIARHVYATVTVPSVTGETDRLCLVGEPGLGFA